jgi:RNA polymerase sigma-70 factor (ECF subfamily)
MHAPETPASGNWSDWLEAARWGSPEAAGKLFEGCRQYLQLIANQQVDGALAVKVAPSDLVQETLLKAHREFNQFGGQSEAALLGWLRSILLNTINDADRRYRGSDKRDLAREVPFPRAPEQLQAEIDSPSSIASAREQDELLLRALDQLPVERQQVIRWRNYDRLPFEEIGQRLGVSAEAARKTWARALRELQAKLEPPHGTG